MSDSYFDKLMGILGPLLGQKTDAPANANNSSGSLIPWTPDMTPSKGVPGPEVLSGMPLGDFRKLRESYPGQSDQNYIAPFEHRAYVREWGSNLPEKLILGAVLPSLYNVGKSTGLVHGRSQPSWEEWRQSLAGAFDKTPN